jgi:hypothetical protein
MIPSNLSLMPHISFNYIMHSSSPSLMLAATNGPSPLLPTYPDLPHGNDAEHFLTKARMSQTKSSDQDLLA